LAYDEEVLSSEAGDSRGAGAFGRGGGGGGADVGRYGTGGWGRGQGVGGVEEYDEEEDEGGADVAGHREYQDELPSEQSLL